MSKLTKFLSKNGKFLERNDSGSEYYQLGDKKIRLSNHLPKYVMDTNIHILLPQNSKSDYIVVFLGIIYIHHSYTTLRLFLEHTLMFSHIYENKIKVLEREAITKLKKELAELQNLALQGSTLNLNMFTEPQRNAINGFIKTNKENKKK